MHDILAIACIHVNMCVCVCIFLCQINFSLSEREGKSFKSKEIFKKFSSRVKTKNTHTHKIEIFVHQNV